MSIHSRPAIEMVRGAVLAVTMLLFVGGHGNTQPAATQGAAAASDHSTNWRGVGLARAPSICPMVGMSRSNAGLLMMCYTSGHGA